MTGLVDDFGADLLLVARVLTGDVEAAEELVIRVIVARGGEDQSSLRDLAAAVHVVWQSWDRPAPAHSPADGTPSLHDQLRGLPEDQRAALALCAYGDHTHRQAAVVLDLPPHTVARLLCTVLRILAVPHDLSPAAVPSRSLAETTHML